SITDGQIVLDTKLFAEGHKPAVDVGTSVSRVGGKTQVRALRDAVGHMRLSYAQFLELELFTRFGERPEPRVKAQIERGQRLRALLSQPQFQPLRVVDQVVLALAWDAGLFDPLPVEAVSVVRARLPAWLDHDQPTLAPGVDAATRVTPELREAALASVQRLLADADLTPPISPTTPAPPVGPSS
ncbi:MAG: F0F1 ATP synthase subunit alpha, partial [Hydrogenophaga sp.]|nr:F0F1 ATP synthase subunit alpha [Hydrogenophaga sp.]